ncbi:MAG: hypothetical protein NC244_13705 [Alistipes senegalensis]|nr:hypothetical protein [Alistipes senegalensis]
MTEMNCKYLMRLQGSCFRGVKENSGNDFRITIIHNNKIYSVKIVCVVLKSGEVETWITNLSENELNTDKFRNFIFCTEVLKLNYVRNLFFYVYDNLLL